MKWIILIPSGLVLFACIKKNNGLDYLKKSKQDTIYAPKSVKASNNDCISIQQGYRAKFGVIISKFYEVNQILVLDNDSVAILKPYYTQLEFSECYPEKNDNNLLIVHNFKSKKTKVYDNLLFPENRVVFQELKENGNSFVIQSEQGSSSKFFTNIYISKNKIDSIKIESWGFNQYSKDYKFKNLHLDKFKAKLIDSLQQKLSN